jgi:hypothetical protein
MPRLTPMGVRASEDEEVPAYRPSWMDILMWMIVAGTIAVAVYALQSVGPRSVLSTLAVGILLSGASLLAGGLVGFLFGIPRSPQPLTTPAEPGKSPSTGAPPQSGRDGYQGNTNLEQISDWLTKILVGVGLTQIPAIRDALKQSADYMGAGLGPAGPQVAMATILYFSVCGFLYGFLWSRLFLIGEFTEADLAVRAARVEAGEKQARIDARALHLTNKYLSDEPDAGTVPIDQLRDAIVKASKNVKTTIFYQAWKVRSETWRDPSTKPKMERTIPIFKALVDADTDGIYHTNRAQLALALKDKTSPTDEDLRLAEELLTKAIEIRDRRQEGGWLIYEANRAWCRIRLDPAFRQQQPSSVETRQQILADLRAAARAEDLRTWLLAEPLFHAWMELNGLEPRDLEIT